MKSKYFLSLRMERIETVSNGIIQCLIGFQKHFLTKLGEEFGKDIKYYEKVDNNIKEALTYKLCSFTFFLFFLFPFFSVLSGSITYNINPLS